MSEMMKLGVLARRGFLRAAGGLALIAAAQARAQQQQGGQVSIDNFTFSPATLTVKAGGTVTLDESRRHSPQHRLSGARSEIARPGQRPEFLV